MTEPEGDAFDEIMRAAGIGAAPTPSHWQAIERTVDFETQQVETRRLIAERMAQGDRPSERAMASRMSMTFNIDTSSLVAAFRRASEAAGRAHESMLRMMRAKSLVREVHAKYGISLELYGPGEAPAAWLTDIVKPSPVLMSKTPRPRIIPPPAPLPSVIERIQPTVKNWNAPTHRDAHV